MKSAIIRWKQKTNNPKYQQAPMRIEDIVEVGEGPHFIHIFITPGAGPILEVNLHHERVESVTIIDEDVLDGATRSTILDSSGKPIGDEVQSAEQLPVEQDDAGSTPVVPAIV